ncbi:transcription antitermination factor NusB [Trueperella sp. LYQ143]|uniref:transcription antitermination factor NusB n=1 Tax=unclassified Trueperella TaxID=2630174 RepID=UPI003983BFFA
MSRPHANRPGRKGRSLQRHKALDVLFEADARQVDLAQLLTQRTQISTHQVPIGEYGVAIVQAYLDNSADVDSMIEAASPAWSLDRMSMVDRNLLRMGATEMMFLGVDAPIAITEIASLARDFSSDSSVGFTMGVLNRICEIRAGETAGLTEKCTDNDGDDISEADFQADSSAVSASLDESDATAGDKLPDTPEE